jgi:hypothetical protein
MVLILITVGQSPRMQMPQSFRKEVVVKEEETEECHDFVLL